MSQISITIDGIKCEAREGEYILNIARRNNIFIPAICYMSGCSPTLACRLCMADVDGKRVYTCNAKAKDGQIVITNTQDIENERRSIMEVYAVNHPLECGVCDQSGECELQNYVHKLEVSNQPYTIRNTHKNIEKWGLTRYDPSLCIMCERCITTCKDMIGDNCLTTTPRGEELAVPKELKDSMPKDSYAVWNRLQKSLISKTNIGNCSDCGACVEACPVGALVGTDFHYLANSWELSKIPAANPHSSDCSLMYYEVKHTNIENNEPKIYRVCGEGEFSTLNGAARFGYDFENRVQTKDKKSFNKIIDFITGKADTIVFNSFITNEEALILQKIKEKYNLKLVNNDAYKYQRFLNKVSQISGKSLYSGDLDAVKNSNFIVSIGSMIRYDSPNAGYAINNALKMNKASLVYAHPIGDKVVNSYSKNVLHLSYASNTEEAILYILLEMFVDFSKVDPNIKEYLDSLHVKTTKEVEENIVEELREIVTKTVIDENSGEEKSVTEEVVKKITKTIKKEIEVNTTKLWEFADISDLSEEIRTLANSKDKLSLIVGEDILSSQNWENLAMLVGIFEYATPFDVVIIPSQTNTLGVSLICDLDENAGEQTVGYNERGVVKLSALGDGTLDMPSLNQQEGTFTNINKRVVPTNAALPYHGYIINDVANALGIVEKYTIDYTQKLPTQKGFEQREFDSLPNYYDNAGIEHRGYFLHVKDVSIDNNAKSIISDFKTINNAIYMANPITQFNYFTNKAHQLRSKAHLYVSTEFLEIHGLKDGDLVQIICQDKYIKIPVKLDSNISGLIPYIPTFDSDMDIAFIFQNGYRFANLKMEILS